MKAINKEGKVIEISEYGFRGLEAKGWVRFIEPELINDEINMQDHGEDEDYKQEEKECAPAKELDLIPAEDEQQLEPESDEEKEADPIDEPDEQEEIDLSDLPDKIGTAHSQLVKEAKPKGTKKSGKK